MTKINWKELEKKAKEALNRAYAPYSQFHVGAAVLAESGAIYTGCNVENASYGGTVCAERVAIWKAVSEGEKRISAVLVTTLQDTLVPPCGFCRQVINEFASGDCPVAILSATGELKEMTVATLLPESFGPKFLNKNSRNHKK